jgi:hypothetical protein
MLDFGWRARDALLGNRCRLNPHRMFYRQLATGEEMKLWQLVGSLAAESSQGDAQ